MRKIVVTINACALLVGASCLAQAQTGSSPAAAGEIVTASATVENVDKDNRKVTLKAEDGSNVTIKVPESVRNFDQIKKGDTVTAKYSESIAVGIRKADEAPVAVEEETIQRAPAGAKPGGEASVMEHITATVENIDTAKREVTLKRADGTTTKVSVPQDVKKFDSLKQGDQVVVNATESLAIEVTPK